LATKNPVGFFRLPGSKPPNPHVRKTRNTKNRLLCKATQLALVCKQNSFSGLNWLFFRGFFWRKKAIFWQEKLCVPGSAQKIVVEKFFPGRAGFFRVKIFPHAVFGRKTR